MENINDKTEQEARAIIMTNDINSSDDLGMIICEESELDPILMVVLI
jgi:hypothetical protein